MNYVNNDPIHEVLEDIERLFKKAKRYIKTNNRPAMEAYLYDANIEFTERDGDHRIQEMYYHRVITDLRYKTNVAHGVIEKELLNTILAVA